MPSIKEDFVSHDYDYKKLHDFYAENLPERQSDLTTLNSMYRNGDLPVKKVGVGNAQLEELANNTAFANLQDKKPEGKPLVPNPVFTKTQTDEEIKASVEKTKQAMADAKVKAEAEKNK
jgi:hypothetical protein